MHGAERRLVLRRRLRQLRDRDDARQRGDLGDVEEDEQASLDERHRVELPDRQHVEPQRDRHGQHGDRAADSRRGSSRACGPSGRSARRPAAKRSGREARAAPMAMPAAAGESVSARISSGKTIDAARGAERRDDLPAPQQHVVPGFPERRRGACSLLAMACARRRRARDQNTVSSGDGETEVDRDDDPEIARLVGARDRTGRSSSERA